MGWGKLRTAAETGVQRDWLGLRAGVGGCVWLQGVRAAGLDVGAG